MILAIKYNILRLVRNRQNIFWILLFPIALGTLFKVAFSNLDASEKFNPIPVAIVCEEGKAKENFIALAESLSEGDSPMLDAVFCSEGKAMEKLEDKDIDGIIFADDSVRLSISGNMSNASMNQSILSSLVDQYNVTAAILEDAATNRPETLAALSERIMQEAGYTEEVSYAYHESSTFDQYFYNLIAMACLYTAMGGVTIAIGNQANLSPIAARKTVSCASKGMLLVSELIAHVMVEFLLNLMGYAFLVLVLRVDMTMRLGLTILAIFVSTLTGISLGLFIGSVGKKAENFKLGMVFAVVMPCCFFSGLMMGDMRMIVEKAVPWFNHINPAALISDCFYSLTAYESLDRYFMNLFTLLGLSVVMTGTGIIMSRRNRYASI